MDFNPVMMVMQPRFIWESLASLKKNIDIPTAYFRAYSEPQVIKAMNKFINETSYSHYIVMSDDGVVSKRAADTILKYGEMKEYDVFTGWMNMHIESDGSLSPISTVSQGMLPKILDDNGPIRKEYPPWIPMKWVEKQEGVIQITMANFAMSIAERDIFLKFPLLTHPNGCSSDHHWSYRLQQAGLQVYTHTDAFIKHLRQGWFPWKHNWLVGQEPAKTIYPRETV